MGDKIGYSIAHYCQGSSYYLSHHQSRKRRAYASFSAIELFLGIIDLGPFSFLHY